MKKYKFIDCCTAPLGYTFPDNKDKTGTTKPTGNTGAAGGIQLELRNSSGVILITMDNSI